MYEHLIGLWKNQFGIRVHSFASPQGHHSLNLYFTVQSSLRKLRVKVVYFLKLLLLGFLNQHPFGGVMNH